MSLFIRTFSMNGVVVETERVADFIEKFRLLTSRSVKHIELSTERFETVVMDIRKNRLITSVLVVT
jgi:hypothetical protein